jgi:membrane protein YqaA with SNARE-associated domain
VAGGALGYAIGELLFDSVGQWIVHFYGLSEKMESLREQYARIGGLIIVVKGITPIPYKLVTIVSGVMGYNFAMFLGLSFLTRGARFFLIALGIRHFGEAINEKLERYFGWFLAGLASIVVIGFVVTAKLL